MAKKDANSGKQAQGQQQPEFVIQRVYVKDLSFEAPNTPHMFQQDWQPQVNIDLQTQTAQLEKGVYEVVLTVTVTAKVGEKVAFLVEVQQAGIFTLNAFSEDQIGPVLGSFCPNILFPYAREVVSDVVVRGGFPQLYLAPINFDALYEQHLQAQKQGDTKVTAAESANDEQAH